VSQVAGNRKQPGGEGAALRLVGSGALPDTPEGLLQYIFRRGPITYDPEGDPQHEGGVTVIQGFQGSALTARDLRCKLFVGQLLNSRVGIGKQTFLSLLIRIQMPVALSLRSLEDAILA
jgi:hypothetical protein